MSMLQQWKGRTDFLKAQAQVVGILLIAYVGNNWPQSYPRNDNHDPKMFWIMNAALGVAAVATLKHEPSTNPANANKVTLLSRAQTEEWKGWMQWAFIMYHYYRVFYVYNEIRVFVSSYVWMTGFGNFLYFDKKQDYSIDRMVSMWLRINYFPLLLSTFLSVPLELYYVVPLHTVGFFITMANCFISRQLELKFGMGYWGSRLAGVFICLLAHILFYETNMKDVLLYLGQPDSHEYHFRFQSDKYSAWLGILCGMMWKKFTEVASSWYGNGDVLNTSKSWAQRAAGVSMIAVWYMMFGSISDKFVYNPIHPYVFWIPLGGWLLIRNSSKYLCELHSTALEFFGRITLETYVLQFHLFMCQNVQHIPIVIPGSGGADANIILKTANMLLCGVVFVAVALWARKVTVTTQMTLVELMAIMRGTNTTGSSKSGNPLRSTSTVALSNSQHNGTNSASAPSEEMAHFIGNQEEGGVEMRSTKAKVARTEVV